MRRCGGPSTKSLDSDENFKPQHTLFCCDIEICSDLRTNLWPQKVLFWVKNSVCWARNALLHGIYESIATVGEIRVYWRADFQSGSRVLKKVF